MKTIEELLFEIAQNTEQKEQFQKELRNLCNKLGVTPADELRYKANLFNNLREKEIDARTISIINLIEQSLKIIQPTAIKIAEPKAFFSPRENCYLNIIEEIEKSKESIDICVFTISDNRISERVIEAHNRGLKVRIITDNEKLFDKGSDIEYLYRSGIDVKIDNTKHHMHHKFAIFDKKRLITGSYNWTLSANEYNHENIVVLKNAKLIGKFVTVFNKLWTEMSDF
ncbi:MAG TPA: hypothetical protein DCQ31_14340 [Bacteroidales bacterium]|nr:hypothetical protein [Bacteroidales bacterium]